ncbi:OmpA family protein [Methylophilus sp.]|uniref:OmpA family protein n=1 Tax=Methylophilus sp. TaxID=29541 RepID=UPI004035BE88
MKNNLWKIVALALLLSACKSAPTSPAKTEAASAEGASTKPAAAKAQSKDNSDKAAHAENVYAAYLSNRQIYFEYDKVTFRQEYQNLIAVHAKYLLSHPQTKILLQGHSDERGTAKYNYELGKRRAEAVKNAFSDHGVKKAQLVTISYGNQQASQDCADEECHKRDRRVDISYGMK